LSVWDSHISERATLANLAENGLDPHAITLQDALAPLPDAPALVVIKVSKYQALLEQQLLALCGVVTPATRIIAAGKAKDIHTSTLKLFEKYLGETRTSLAWKKARLIHCTPAAERRGTTTPRLTGSEAATACPAPATAQGSLRQSRQRGIHAGGRGQSDFLA
jgi:23S rRNA (guanine1835-N2)-methyltransferase